MWDPWFSQLCNERMGLWVWHSYLFRGLQPSLSILLLWIVNHTVSSLQLALPFSILYWYQIILLMTGAWWCQQLAHCHYTAVLWLRVERTTSQQSYSNNGDVSYGHENVLAQSNPHRRTSYRKRFDGCNYQLGSWRLERRWCLEKLQRLILTNSIIQTSVCDCCWIWTWCFIYSYLANALLISLLLRLVALRSALVACCDVLGRTLLQVTILTTTIQTRSLDMTTTTKTSK